ncbi:GNAT family N-acetyltransferase [Leifsonia sp. RAF41]|uniref:GNAT family N-acetyltransferase n=1 Tax=Leifsonia sp. RAF41 TaxID=3233056 RepID=UPI003F9602AC
MPHPFPWEHDVQRWIRDQKPPLGATRTLDLGFDGGELRAVAAVEHLGEEFVHILVVARAVEIRGAHLGSHIVEHALDLAASAVPPEFEHVIVSANIHRRNAASQLCFERIGFTRDVFLVDPNFEQWLIRLDLETS